MARRRIRVARSEQDFDVLVREHSQSIRRYALSLLRDPWLADDALQETFLRAWKYLPSVSHIRNVQAWLISICRNVSFDILAGRKELVGLRDTNVVDIRPLTARHDMESWLVLLTIEHREVLYLVDVLGYDYATVAEGLDLAVGTVRSRIHRARAALRSKVSEFAEQIEGTA